MEINEYLEKVAKITANDIPDDAGKIYVSRFDGSYVAHVGMESKVKFLADREITEQLTRGVGFSPKDGKWYGWSHRAIFGFKVGSKIKKGDCAYVPSDWEDARVDAVRFWSMDGDHHKNVTATDDVDKDGRKCFSVSWVYTDDVPAKKLRSQIGGCRHYPPEKFGHGEWTAETLDDAKQMAVDFNEGVS